MAHLQVVMAHGRLKQRCPWCRPEALTLHHSSRRRRSRGMPLRCRRRLSVERVGLWAWAPSIDRSFKISKSQMVSDGLTILSILGLQEESMWATKAEGYESSVHARLGSWHHCFVVFFSSHPLALKAQSDGKPSSGRMYHRDVEDWGRKVLPPKKLHSFAATLVGLRWLKEQSRMTIYSIDPTSLCQSLTCSSKTRKDRANMKLQLLRVLWFWHAAHCGPFGWMIWPNHCHHSSACSLGHGSIRLTQKNGGKKWEDGAREREREKNRET